MTYHDIIIDNQKNKSVIKWWPFYAFHYTDIENALSILHMGCLYGRLQAESMHLMNNENASRQVISTTSQQVRGSVRLYFRPLTPTQYHNEGYKHRSLRFNGEEGANVPVPVFFLFDLEALLSQAGVFFSETSQAGIGGDIMEGVEAFKKMDFSRIYDIGWMEHPEEDKKYRQAEILCSDSLQVKPFLKKILCRTDIERNTLLNILRSQSRSIYEEYYDKIDVQTEDLFEYNGLYVSECEYYNGKISISYSHTTEKINYMNKYRKADMEPIQAKAVLDWYNAGGIIKQQVEEYLILYDQPMNIIIDGLTPLKEATFLYITLYIEGHRMAYLGTQLSRAALLQ